MNADLDRAFAAFTARVRARLEVGARSYRDQSLTWSPTRLVGEIQQEVEDIAGWATILWMRLERLRERLGPLEKEAGT